MHRNVIETVMGALVLVIAAVFLFFTYSTAQVRAVAGYEVTAKFDHIEGVREGGDVRVSGIKVGTILSATLESESYLAVVRMSIDPAVKLPSDSVAKIESAGLLGDKFMAIIPGSSEKMVKANGVITNTQAPVSIEDMIGQYIFSQTSSGKSGGGGGSGGGLDGGLNVAPKGGEGGKKSK